MAFNKGTVLLQSCQHSFSCKAYSKVKFEHVEIFDTIFSGWIPTIKYYCN